jgi:hypothetical protein
MQLSTMCCGLPGSGCSILVQPECSLTSKRTQLVLDVPIPSTWIMDHKTRKLTAYVCFLCPRKVNALTHTHVSCAEYFNAFAADVAVALGVPADTIYVATIVAKSSGTEVTFFAGLQSDTDKPAVCSLPKNSFFFLSFSPRFLSPPAAAC